MLQTHSGSPAARPKEFSIAVTFNQRIYRYKVEQRPVSKSEEIISIIAPKKTVLLTTSLPVSGQGGNNRKRIYHYDKSVMSNKTIMDRIITAIEQHRNTEGHCALGS